LHRHRIARLIVLGAVAAGKVTAADYHHLGKKGAVTEPGKNARRAISD
jgi:hypothetical protein